MEWRLMIAVAVISGIVYVLNSLFRKNEEEQKGNRQRPTTRERTPSDRPRNTSSTEIDRFLEEINRRRRESAGRSETAQAGTRPPQGATSRGQPVRPEPVRRRPAPPTARSPVPRPVARREPPVPEVILVEEPPKATPRKAVSPAGTIPVLWAEPAARSALPAAPKVPTVSGKSVSPTLAQLMPLLRSPQTLRTAILLQEILGPPLCQRERMGNRGHS